MKEFRTIKGFERYSVSKDGTVINNMSGIVLSQREAMGEMQQQILR